MASFFQCFDTVVLSTGRYPTHKYYATLIFRASLSKPAVNRADRETGKRPLKQT